MGMTDNHVIRHESETIRVEGVDYRLEYRLIRHADAKEGKQERDDYYGVAVTQFCKRDGQKEYLYDFCQAEGVAEDREVASWIYDQLKLGLVMPVSLYEIIDELYQMAE
ncbi:MAG: DUF6514 family protein [Lachnospiraceae bacterium]|nr:DUF6514 family protein [Lachnospiraceae bacterium]